MVQQECITNNMTPKAKAIKIALKHSGGTMHLGKKGAPGFTKNEMTPKEQYYRKSNEVRTDNRIKKFENSGYGRHLTEREHRRGEN